MKRHLPTYCSMLLTASLVMTGPWGQSLQAQTQNGPTVTVTAEPSQASGDQKPELSKVEKMLQEGKTPPSGILINPPVLDRAERVPEQIANVGVKEHRGDKLPLDLRFTDETGKEVRLGDLFKPGKPVILDLGYYSCPMLCDLVMNGMCDSIKEMKWLPGEDYQIIFLSIDPVENYKLAAAKKATYIADLNEASGDKKVDPDSWRFLTGDKDNIEALAQAVGFAYEWDQRQMQFAHPAVLTILTPEGQISRYLYGVKFPVQTLRLSLVEASEGKIGSAMDAILLTCFHYDSSIGSYTVSARRLMTAGGYLTVLVLASVISIALLRERNRKMNLNDHGDTTSM